MVRFFDREANPEYQHVHPGTVTVQGYGIEMWDYEQTQGPGLRDSEKNYLYHVGDLPEPGGKELIRRLHELRNEDEGRSLGENLDYDEADLEQFVGDSAIAIADGEKSIDAMLDVCLAVLNRGDTFKNFATKFSIAQEWTHIEGEGILGIMGFFWQMVISGEVARRLDRSTSTQSDEQGQMDGMSLQVVASLIVYDLWRQNVDLKISYELPMPPAKDVSSEERIEAEVLLRMAKKFMADTRPDIAAETLEEAIAIDPANVEYRHQRCLALRKTAELDALVGDEEDSEMRYAELTVEAKYLTQYAPEDWQAWELLAEAQTGRGALKKGLQAYEQAESVATSDEDKKYLQSKVVEARVALVDEFLGATRLDDKVEQHEAMRDIRDWNYDFVDGAMKSHSNVHERQEEGLVAFAKKIKWPHVDEVTQRIEGTYARLHSGAEENLPANIHDWLYGLVLPGRFFAYNVMSCLVLCTPSLSLGIPPSASHGLVLGDISYWPIHTVMGRVLGGISGIGSLTGWIGPCSSVMLDVETEHQSGRTTGWVFVDGERVAPELQSSDELSEYLDNEDTASYIVDSKGPRRWTTPERPVRDTSQYTLKTVHIKSAGEGQAAELSARIIFEVNELTIVEMPLRTTPVFVVPPRCQPSDPAGHPIHVSELEINPAKSWAPDKLLDDNVFGDARTADMLVINATGNGAETMARAVCAFRGMNAVIRTPESPCFACTLKAARSLNINTVIWCD